MIRRRFALPRLPKVREIQSGFDFIECFTTTFLRAHSWLNWVGNSEWNNLNKIPTNVQGSNVVNSAGGIMIQATAFDYASSITRSLPTYDRLKSKGINRKIYTHPSLPPRHIFNRAGPRVLPSHLQLLTRHNGRRPCTNTVFGGGGVLQEGW